MTAAEFDQLPETNQFVELIDGEVLVSPSPVTSHQHAAGRIYLLLELTSSGQPRRGTTYIAPLEVHFDEHTVLIPDVFWVSADSPTCTLGADGYWYGPPDLVVEVLSPSTARQDRGRKLALYEQFGVREYWIVDAVHQTLEQRVLQAGRYTLTGTFGPGDVLTSPLFSDQSLALDPVFAR
jgi:Uma2 family endonuclease